MHSQQMTFDEVVEMEHVAGDPGYAEWLAARARRERALASPVRTPDAAKPGHSTASDRASVA